MEQREHKPFAITARTLGMVERPFTRILLVNLNSPHKISASYANALWDTGAATSVMSAKLAALLGFDFRGEREYRSIGSSIRKAALGYAYVSLVSNGDVVETLTAIVDEDVGEDYSFIIGMDFIRKGSFALTCTKFETTLSFTIPAAPAVDFAKLLEGAGIDSDEARLGLTVPEPLRVYYGREALGLILQKQK